MSAVDNNEIELMDKLKLNPLIDNYDCYEGLRHATPLKVSDIADYSGLTRQQDLDHCMINRRFSSGYFSVPVQLRWVYEKTERLYLNLYPKVSEDLYFIPILPKKKSDTFGRLDDYHYLTWELSINVHRVMTKETAENLGSPELFIAFTKFMKCVWSVVGTIGKIRTGKLLISIHESEENIGSYLYWLLDGLLHEWVKYEKSKRGI